MYNYILQDNDLDQKTEEQEIKNVQDTKDGSTLDNLFENLTSDIEHMNKFISSLNDKKQENIKEEQAIFEEREKIDKAKKEFDNYMQSQQDEFERNKQKTEQYLVSQKEFLTKAEEEFRINMDNSLTELDLSKKELEVQREKLNEEKEQFEAYKNLELERIRHSEEILNSDRKEFEQYKEISNQKIELENRNLEQKCNRFKEIINQFNANFRPIIDSNESNINVE